MTEFFTEARRKKEHLKTMSNKNNRDRAPSQGGAARGVQNDGSETDRAGMRQWSWDFLSSTLRARLHKECAQGMEREVGGGSGWGAHVQPWLIHVNVWQNPLQYCKVISLQLR